MDLVVLVVGTIAALVAAVGTVVAVRLGRDAEARSTERSDVDWSVVESGDRWVLANDGQDTAFEVRAVVWINATEHTVEAEEAAPGWSVFLDAPIEQPQVSLFGPTTFTMPAMQEVSWRVTWRSELGSWRTATGR